MMLVRGGWQGLVQHLLDELEGQGDIFLTSRQTAQVFFKWLIFPNHAFSFMAQYCWVDLSGPDLFFGQDAELWCLISSTARHGFFLGLLKLPNSVPSHSAIAQSYSITPSTPTIPPRIRLFPFPSSPHLPTNHGDHILARGRSNGSG